MPQEEMKVVSSCPKCGGPIYAQACKGGSCAPRTVYSCDCRLQPKTNNSSSNGGMFKTGAIS